MNATTKPTLAFQDVEPGRVIGRGHAAGDFLGAYDWSILDEAVGRLRLDAAIPDRVRNPRGQLFGGFTGTYVDMVALFTVRAGHSRNHWRGWLATSNLRIDYLEPVVGERVILEGRVLRSGRKSHLVEVRFLDLDGLPLVHALVSMLESS